MASLGGRLLALWLAVGVPSSCAEAAAPSRSPRPLPSHWTLDGQLALVTGGSKGLGRAIVEELLSHGCTVLTCARDISPLWELSASNPRCTAVAADVSTPEGRATLLAALDELSDGTTRKRSAAAALDETQQDGEGTYGLDILVNNVGVNLRKASEAYTDAEYEMIMATNQASAFHLSRSCLRHLRLRRGSIINLSSVSGSTVDSTGAPYHMSKAALEHMTRYLACEWGKYGVRVNALAPWFIRTKLTEPLLAEARFLEAVEAATPMGRVGECYEVASVAAFLAMPAAGYISGQVIGVDGAMAALGFRYAPR